MYKHAHIYTHTNSTHKCSPWNAQQSKQHTHTNSTFSKAATELQFWSCLLSGSLRLRYEGWEVMNLCSLEEENWVFTLCHWDNPAEQPELQLLPATPPLSSANDLVTRHLFLDLQNGANRCIYCVVFLWEMFDTAHTTYFNQCLIHNRCSINIS